MNVAVVGLRGIPDILGGVEAHCEQVMPRVVDANPHICVTVIGRTPYVKQDSTYKGVDVTSVYAPRGKHLEAIVATFLSILKAARGGFELVHIHAIGPALLSPMVRLMGLKVVVTHHGEDFQREKWNTVAKLSLRMGEWLGVHFAHKVIAVSPSLQRKLHARFPKHANRIAYIPNGMTELPHDTTKDRAVLAEFGLQKGSFFLVAARLVPEKGIDYLIEAYRESGSDKRLVIAGSAMHGSSYSEDLLSQAAQDVTFTGNLTRSKLAVLYDNSALFVLPSYHEGLPIAALEALSFGGPILLSNIAANTDLGLPERNYFPVGNVKALAQRLRADSFDDLKPRSWQGLERFDWDAIASELSQIYLEL